MNEYQRHIELLGFKAKDKVTGFKGVISSVCFDAYGCIQAAISPSVDDKGEIPSAHWFDVTRLEVDTKKRVIDLPNFVNGYVAEGKKGAAVKPPCRV